MPTFPVQVSDREVSLEFADSVYPVAAVLGTAVVHIDKAFIRVAQLAEGRTRISIRPKLGAASREELDELGGQVWNELLHQALRIEVGTQTDKLRELVIGKGIMSAEAVTDGGVSFSEDPLGIARPWEETYLGEENGGRK